jgi:outer membrane protein
MKKTTLFILSLILIFPPLARADNISLGLREAVVLALRDNRDIILKTMDLEKAKLKIAESKAVLFPTLTFTGGWTDTRGYYSKDIGSTTTQFSFKQYLYKGGKTINTIKYNGHKFEVVSALLDKAKLETVFNTHKAFYTLLLAKELERLNKDILENTRAHLDLIKERYSQGQAAQSEILQIEASLEDVSGAYQASLNQAEAMQALLSNLLFLDKEVRVDPKGGFDYAPQEVAYDEAFIKAMRQRPEIRQYEAQGNADKSAAEAIKADSRPSIYASWDYYSRSHAAGSTGGLGKGWNDYNVLGLAFSWPIFDGFATRAKLDQAIVDLKETQLTKGKVERDIALELKNAYLYLRDSLAKINVSKSNIEYYRNVLDVMKEKYSGGIISSLDLDDASLGLEVALFSHKQAIYDYLVAKSSFEKASGGV